MDPFMQAAIEEAENRLGEAEALLAEKRQAVERLEAERRRNSEERAGKLAEHTRLKAQLEVLEQAEQSLAGYAEGARFLLDAAMIELQRLPGIGPWSAGLIMLRGLRRLDIFPAGDTGAAKSLTALLELPVKLKPAEAVAFADRFEEQRGYLYFLCLGSRLPWLGAAGSNG